ncbi:hypothetical protein E6C27_scaffold616G00620 [Cucumis melo var. makuwa]|uniref:Uncharacterized protein n=1 Tax=Cucumis melo var. makuwa TaxID=1194695 RepID=A0A5A7VBW3_CUCMM|nr:hypothetical protein E6C27_scaffold616G00620 [Cucumis melo var. makuwa]
MFLKLESSKKAWIFKGVSIVEDVLEVGVFEEIHEFDFYRGRSGFCRQIHRPGRRDRVPSSFGEVVLPSAIQLLSREDRAFVVRSTVLVGAIEDFCRLERGDTVVNDELLSGYDRAFAVRSIVLVGPSGHLHRLERWYCRQRSSFYHETIGHLPSYPPLCDPTSIGGRLGFCRQIHRPSRSDRGPSSFGEVVLLSTIKLLLGDDRAFTVRSTTLVGAIRYLPRLERWYCNQRSNFHRGTIELLPSDPRHWGRSSFYRQIHHPGRCDRVPSSFGEVVLPLAIQLLSRDDRAFAVRSTILVGAIEHLRHLERWYCRQRSNFYRGTIWLLPSDPPP